jgi:hypothetical protein
MDNRERDKMSKNTESTSAGDVNRTTSSQIGKNKSDSSADFSQNIGRSDNLNEPNSRTGNVGSSGYESSKSPNRPSDDKSMGSESTKTEPASGSRH